MDLVLGHQKHLAAEKSCFFAVRKNATEPIHTSGISTAERKKGGENIDTGFGFCKGAMMLYPAGSY